MHEADRNAVIWYADDGYNPETKGLNGRRVAGASFLKGFFAHAAVDEFVSLTHGEKGKAGFAERHLASGRSEPHRGIYAHAPTAMAPLGTLYYPSPNFADQTWLRQRFGMAGWSICGITHTTATRAVMRGLVDLRAGPQAAWDAIICTSRAVQAATRHNLDLADAHLRQRFGKLPPRPQLPIIPLGITCDDFTADPAARLALRARKGWTDKDIVIATLSRLLPYGKFDPGPLFVAMQAAQDQLPKGLRLHFLACGVYGDTHSKAIFEGCARTFMPGLGFTHLDGADPVARRETLSGADVFAFPIDNIQETFGLAPLEAMAAGLPVLTSDWDGMRDTVTEDVGIRVPSVTVSGAHTGLEAWRYQVERLTYAQYGNNTSAMTALDMRAMIDAIVALARDPALRARMGAAGKARARVVYDWSAIIPQMQDLWAELAAIRHRAGDVPRGPVGVAPSPMQLFAAYPSRQISPGAGRFHAVPGRHDIAAIFAARRYAKMKQMFEISERIARIHAALIDAGPGGATAEDLARAVGLPSIRVERVCVFLMKYGLARHEPE